MWQAYKVNRFIDITAMYSLFERHYEKGYRFKGEMHNFWECVYVIDGNVNIIADGLVHRLRAGDIIFHKPFEMHKFFTDNEKGVTHFTFSFSATGQFESEISGKVFRLDTEQKSVMNAMINHLRESLGKATASQELPHYNKALTLLNTDPIFSQKTADYMSAIVLSLASNGNIRSAVCSDDSENFGRAVEYMKSNLSIRLCVEEIAVVLNISVSGLKRLFEKYSGLGVHKYFLTLKIKTATEMLEKGIGVGEVAYKLGFSSQGYFSACYKRETGKNPSEVLKAVK